MESRISQRKTYLVEVMYYENHNTEVVTITTDNINWKALYKVLEAEVETVILDPNCPSYVKEWGQRVMDRLKQHLPR